MTDATQSWAARLAPYKRPDDRRAIFEVAITLVPFILLWYAVWALLQIDTLVMNVMAGLVLLPAAGLMVRLFIIQHDCGHGSMFSSRKANDWVGRVLGVITLTPYEYWRRLHATHHAGSGNLDRRGTGDIDTLTIDEYLQKSTKGRLLYRLYRHPAVMFGLGPAYLFIFRHRVPIGSMHNGRIPWLSTLTTNAGIVLMSAALIYAMGWKVFFIIHVPIIVIGASIGVWMFYVQHQFEETQWERNSRWDHADAALHGSSYYDLPAPLMWLTGNIGIHHVHHLSSRIPFYKLPQVLSDHPELKNIGRLTFWESIRCVRLALWDEKNKRLVSFSDVRSAVASV
ncbi:MAG: fatty acid desaturase [Granulosicoccus sp.]